MSIKKTDFLKFGEDLYEVIPPAPSEEDRGGIIASPVTEAETIEAKLGDDGKLYVGADPAGSAAAALALANENIQTKFDELSAVVDGKANTTAFTSHTNNSEIHVTQNDKDKWDLAEPNQRAFTRVEVNDDGYSASNSIASTMRFKNGTGIELSITNKDSDADVTITNTGVTGVKGDSESTYRTGNVNITKANIGLSNVDNTKDTNKPVSTAQQTAIDNALSESKDYTDEKVALLLNNSSAAVDSIMELATAMEENEEVVDALEQAIGNKADKTHEHNDVYYTETEIDTMMDDVVYLDIEDNEDIPDVAGGSNIVVDSALSTTSTNPVQNKVVTEKFNQVQEQIDDLKENGVGSDGADGEDGFSPSATVTQTDTGATISITDKNGTTTATITNGKDGEDGYTPVKGKDYFDGSNGLDGSDGKDGYTPIKGTDYWTEEDKQEIQTYIDNEMADLNAQGIQQTISFADGDTLEEALAWLEANGDTSKVYVLPDGYIYGYKMTEVLSGGYTNLAEPIPDNTTDTSKWVKDHRISSSGVSAQTGKTVSNPIIVNTGDVIRVKGTEFVANADRIALWHQNGSAIEIQYVSALPCSSIGYAYVDGVHEFTIKGANITDTNVRFSFTTPTYASSIIITKNEEIVEGTVVKEYAWINTNHAFVPNDYDEEFVELNNTMNRMGVNITNLQTANQEMEASIEAVEAKIESIGTIEISDYWQTHLDAKIATIKALHRQYGKNCFSFVFMTDTHYPSNLGKCSPLLAKKIMDECNIKYAIHGGDAQTRGCHNTKEELFDENKNIEEMFSPIRDRMLFVEGNHDGSYATVNGVTYAKQLTDAEMHEEYFRRIGFVGDVHFCDEANAYYVDDAANKVRYICLDTHCVPNSASDVNSDGTAKNAKFRALNFTQAQFDFLTKEALVDGLTEKWKVVVIGHVYINEGQNDFALMANLLSAYKNKTSYSGSYNGKFTWDSVSVDVDFSNAKGTFVAYICGHKHTDASYVTNGVNCILTRCDAKEENDSSLNAERVKGTITEQSFDVMTVTPSKIYATKIGAGSDRVIDII